MNAPIPDPSLIACRIDESAGMDPAVEEAPATLTLGARIRLAADGPDVPSSTRAVLELLATDADTLTRVGERLVAAAQERPATPPATTESSAPVPGPQIGVHDAGLGDAIRERVRRYDQMHMPNNAQHLEGLADRADEMEQHWTLARNNARLALEQRNEARAQVERVRALHRHDEDPDDLRCIECGTPWPCTTSAALGGAQ
jgi:hypothetical protein